ncbi:ABC transporter ATP-binding protein [Halomonas sp. IOP_31]|uniref:ABC transporter ATP-binding protein n=1 Tax=Halomonas sp. IOP_31 TaxID=2876584 RepID=UPI001E4518B3|nr:ABC transporter ATP-binding protein [Halomonas sp. IOP_31]MCD6007032.1 ABC transporter ATP-binding protein/permease [Halomonas sp. IOP_31]
MKELYQLLTKQQRRKLLYLQALVVVMSFAEIASVISIGPFMALVGDMSQLRGDGLPANLYQLSGLSSPQVFLFWMGVGVLAVLLLAALFSMYTVWRLALYSTYIGADLSRRLFKHYMYQPWLFHANGSSSELTNQISQESLRVTNFIINPLMQINAKLVMVTLLGLAIFFYNPAVAIVGTFIFGMSYILLYRAVRRRLTENGKKVSEQQALRFKLMGEGFGGVKDTLLLGRQEIFIERFKAASESFAKSHGTTLALGQVPRYAIEAIAFGSVIFLVIYLLSSHEGSLGSILPVLSIYALAGFKLLPAFQKIYAGISSIRGNLSAFEAIRDGLQAGTNNYVVASSHRAETDIMGQLVPKKTIELSDITFTYPGKEEPALNGLSLTIPAKKVVGLVGASGSGKTTTIDIILGLIAPQQGNILIDGVPLREEDKRAWQDVLGFVSQSIFLSDASIRENIAFGLPPEEIDEAGIMHAASMAHLDKLLAELPEGLDTFVGERGVQLSGGQRQRIGIARALYGNSEVLVFDEATSALDGITEKLIMDAIHDFSGSKTIIMIAHRLATVKQCDVVYLISQGKVVDQGRYEDLIKRNEVFKRMAEHA